MLLKALCLVKNIHILEFKRNRIKNNFYKISNAVIDIYDNLVLVMQITDNKMTIKYILQRLYQSY